MNKVISFSCLFTFSFYFKFFKKRLKIAERAVDAYHSVDASFLVKIEDQKDDFNLVEEHSDSYSSDDDDQYEDNDEEFKGRRIKSGESVEETPRRMEARGRYSEKEASDEDDDEDEDEDRFEEDEQDEDDEDDEENEEDEEEDENSDEDEYEDISDDENDEQDEEDEDDENEYDQNEEEEEEEEDDGYSSDDDDDGFEDEKENDGDFKKDSKITEQENKLLYEDYAYKNGKLNTKNDKNIENHYWENEASNFKKSGMSLEQVIKMMFHFVHLLLFKPCL